MKENIVNTVTTAAFVPKVMDAIMRNNYGFNIRMEQVKKFREYTKLGKGKEYKSLLNLRK